MGPVTTSTLPHMATGADGEKLFDVSCFSCKKDGLSTTGIYHCHYCGVMCEKCASKHSKEPKPKGHYATKIKILKQDSVAPEFTSIRNCEIHKSKKIRGYCIDCGKLMCSECDAQHESCTIENIDTMAHDVDKNKDIREARLELTDLKNRTKRARKNKMNDMIHVAKQAEEFTKIIHDIREKINILFDKMVATILNDKDEFCKAESLLIEADVKTCKDIAKHLEAVTNLVDEAFKNNKKDDIWVVKKKLEHLTLHYDKIINKTEAESDVKFEFVPNASLSAILQTPENVGKMKVVSSRLHGDSTEVVSRVVQNPKRRKFFKLPWKDDRPDDDVMQPWVKSTRLSKSITPLPAIVRKSNDLIKEGHISRAISQQDYTVQMGSRLSNGYGRASVTNGRQSVSGSTDPVMSGRVSLTDRLSISNESASVANSSRFSARNVAASTNIHIPSSASEPEDVACGDTFGVNKNIKLKILGKKEIQIPSDTEKCSVTGCTFLPNGRLVLVDNHNKTIKLFGSDFEFIAVMAFDERPWDVTTCYDAVVAVTCPYVNVVELVTAESEMIIDNSLKTDRMCHGVCFNKQEKWLYVTTGDMDNSRIQAFSLDGILRKVIIPAIGVLKTPSYMTITSDNSTLYISDRHSGIVGFNMKSGDMVCQYKDPRIKRYWDIEATKEGRLFLITTEPDSLFTSTGDFNGQLVTEFRHGPKPCSLCYRPVSNTLVVTRWTSEDLETFRVIYGE